MLFDLPIRFKNDHNARPHSAQEVVPNTLQQSSTGRFNQAGRSQTYASILPRPPLASLSSYAPTNSALQYQRALPLSGINQDDFSKPLLARHSHSQWEDSIPFASQDLPPSAAPVTNDLLNETIDSAGGHSSDHSLEGPRGSWQWIPNRAERPRPTTAPVMKSTPLAAETLTLSQMLPPDRLLPFPEKKDSRPTSRSSRNSKSFEQLQEMKKTPRANSKYAEPVKAKRSERSRKESPVSRGSLTPNRASTPYNLRPGSSSSNIGPSRPVTSDSTLFSDTTKAPVRERLAESRARLSREGWVLSETEFLQRFNFEAFNNKAFFDELVKFARIEKSFAAAYRFLVKAQAERRDQTPRGHKCREWMSNDVKRAVDLFNSDAAANRKAEKLKTVKTVDTVKANTPRKRVRAVSPVPSEAKRLSRETTQDSAADGSFIFFQPLQSSPKISAVARSRHLATLDADTIALETKPKPADSEPIRSPTLGQQAHAAAPPDFEFQSTIAQVYPPLTPKQQTIALSTPTALPRSPSKYLAAPAQQDTTTTTTQEPPVSPAKGSPSAQDVQPASTPCPMPTITRAPPEQTPKTIIPPADLLALLNTWATTSTLFQPPPTLPQTSKDLLADFASKDDETRAQALDDMICECLEDANFPQLVEDVEGAWMRIGLGF